MAKATSNPALVTPPLLQSLKAPNFSNVAAGQTATCVLENGFSYHYLYLFYSGVTLAQLSKIRVKCNDETVQTFTGVQRDMLNQFDGQPAAAGILKIPFVREGLKDSLQRYLTAIATGVKWGGGAYRAIHDFRIEVDVDAAAAAPVLSLRADVSDANGVQSNGIIRIDSWVENVAAAGEFLVQKALNKDPLRSYLSRIVFGDTNAHITDFRVQENGTDTIVRSSLENELIQKPTRAPQAGWVIYDTTERGEYQRAINAAARSSLSFYLTSTVVNNALPLLTESIGRLAN